MKLRNKPLVGFVAFTVSLMASQAAVIGIDPDPTSKAGIDDAQKSYVYIVSTTKLPNGQNVTGWLVNRTEGAGTPTPVTPLIFQATGAGPSYEVVHLEVSSTASALSEATAHTLTFPIPAVGDFYAGFHQTITNVADPAVGFTTSGTTVDHFFRTTTGGTPGAPGIGDVGVFGGAGGVQFSSTYNGGESLTALTAAPRDYDFGVVVTIPEPSSVFLGFIGLALFLRRRR